MSSSIYRRCWSQPGHVSRSSAIVALVATVALLAASAAAVAGVIQRHGVHWRPPAAWRHACPNITKTPAHASLKTIKVAVVCLVNLERVTYGLPALREDKRLDRSAQGWSRTMVATRQFDHGHDFVARIQDAGYWNWYSAGENIATGYPTPASVVWAWMNSIGHCRNLLDPAYISVGVGVVNKPIRRYATGPATWTQDFAVPEGHRLSADWTPAELHCTSSRADGSGQ
jgi:uncharacterized protein YkwD